MCRDYDINSNKLEQLNKIKLECEDIQNQFEEYKNHYQLQLETLIKEHNEKLKNKEKEKKRKTCSWNGEMNTDIIFLTVIRAIVRHTNSTAT